MRRAAEAILPPLMSNAATYCLLVLLFHQASRVTTALKSSSTSVKPHRALLYNKHSINHRSLFSASAGPGLWALPSSAYATAAGSANLGFMSSTSASQQAASPAGNKAECSSTGKFLPTAPDNKSTRAKIPVFVTSAGGAVIVGATAATSDSSASIGTVHFLDDNGSCNVTYSTKLPSPVPLLPINYEVQLGTVSSTEAAATAAGGGGVLISHVAASSAAEVVLAATTNPAVFAPSSNNRIVQEGATKLPYILTVMSYKRTQKPNATRYSYMPAGILPVPVMAADINATVTTGLAVSADGRTALACLMPLCSNANPSSCGAGAAHVFRLTMDRTANTDAVGGHQWNLVATLPFAGYGTAHGHAVSCSLSRDGGTAAVLAAGAITDTVQVPVAATVSADNASSASKSDSDNASGDRRRLLQSSSVSATDKSADDVYPGSNESKPDSADELQHTTVTKITRRAYLQMYAAVSPGGPWASVGSEILPSAVADCIMATTPCRPMVDVTDKFAAVAYRSGPELKVDVVFHTAPQAAVHVKRCEFMKICSLSKLLVRQSEDDDTVEAPEPSSDLIAAVALRQPSGTLSLRIQVGLRNPGALFLWTLSRREDETCPSVTKNLLDEKGFNPSYNPLPQLMVDASADGNLVVVSGLNDDDGNNRLGVFGWL